MVPVTSALLPCNIWWSVRVHTPRGPRIASSHAAMTHCCYCANPLAPVSWRFSRSNPSSGISCGAYEWGLKEDKDEERNAFCPALSASASRPAVFSPGTDMPLNLPMSFYPWKYAFHWEGRSRELWACRSYTSLSEFDVTEWLNCAVFWPLKAAAITLI